MFLNAIDGKKMKQRDNKVVALGNPSKLSGKNKIRKGTI